MVRLLLNFLLVARCTFAFSGVVVTRLLLKLGAVLRDDKPITGYKVCKENLYCLYNEGGGRHNLKCGGVRLNRSDTVCAVHCCVPTA